MEEKTPYLFTFSVDTSEMARIEEVASELNKEVGDLSYSEAAAVLIKYTVSSLLEMKTGTVTSTDDGRTIVDSAADGQQAYDGFVTGRLEDQLIKRVRTADEIVIEVVRKKKVWERGKRVRKDVAVQTYRYKNNRGAGDSPGDSAED